MDRIVVTKAARALGGNIRARHKNMTTYTFSSEEGLTDFRESIPYWTLRSKLNLNVYFDDPRE